MDNRKSLTADRRPKQDEKLRFPDAVVPERLRSPTEVRAPPRRVSPRRSLGLEDAEGLEQLKRKLSEVENPPERWSPERLEVGDGRSSEPQEGGASPSSKKRPNCHHVLRTSPVREPSLNSQTKVSCQSAVSLRVSGDVSSPHGSPTRRKSPNTRVVISSQDDITKRDDVTPDGRAWRRQVSHPQGAAPLVEEISSEQWCDQLFVSIPQAPVTSPAIVQEVDTDTDSEAGSHTPGTPPCISEVRISPASTGVQIVEEETLHFAAEEQEHWGEEEWTPELLSPAPEHGSPSIMEGANETAVFCTLRPFGSVLRPTLGCLTPMPEEEEDEHSEWGVSPGAASYRGIAATGGDGAPTAAGEESESEDSTIRCDDRAESSESQTVESGFPERDAWCGLSSDPGSGVPDARRKQTWSESLPVEARVRTEPGNDKNNNGDNTVSVKVSDDGYTTVSRSLPNGTREREPEDQVKQCSSFPNYAREKETSNDSESLLNCAKVRGCLHQSIRVSESLPNQSNGKLTALLANQIRAREEANEPQVLEGQAVHNEANRTIPECQTGMSLPNESRSEGDICATSESLANVSRVIKPSSNDDAEVVDRSSDGRYDFSCLRIRRQQAQDAKKKQKDGTTKGKDTSSAVQNSLPSASAPHAPHPAMRGDKANSNFSASAFSKALTPRRGTEIISDMESDRSWQTVHNQMSNEMPPKTEDSTAERPSVVCGLQDKERFMSSTLVLTVEARGTPTPRARWFFKPFLSAESTWTSLGTYMDGTEVETGPDRLVQRCGLRYRLVIPRLKYIDAGVYTVALSNPGGEVSSQCRVVVNPISEVGCATFFTPLVNRRVLEGELVTFRTEVRGSPHPSVTWYKDGTKLRASRDLTFLENRYTSEFVLHLAAARRSDEGVYTCRACNVHGAADARVALAVVSPSQMALRSVFNVALSGTRRIAPGDTLVLAAALNTGRKRQLYWQVNGRPLVTSERVTTVEDSEGFVELTVAGAEPADAGTYQLIVDVEDGGVEVSSADIFIGGDSEDEAGDERADAAPAEEVEVSAGLGSWLPNLFWRREPPQPLPVPQRPSLRGFPEGAATMEEEDGVLQQPGDDAPPPAEPPPLQEPESAVNDMSVSGKEWAPDFTTPLLGGTFSEGSNIELDTHVTGVPIPEICWSKDGVPLDDDERVGTTFDSDKATLSVKDIVTSDAGKYEITIRNKLGEATSSVDVKVKKIYQVPQFIDQLKDVEQTPAMDAKFSCQVTGLPSPEVQWLVNGAALQSGGKYKLRRDQASCSLTVRDCDEQDAGHYTCQATNREGAVDSTATLRIVDKLERKPKLEAPLFLKTLGDCEVFPGMQARFTACVAGYPDPDPEWYRNDVRLYPSDRIQMESDGTGLVRLTLRTVDETDAGRYRLAVRNSEGSASCEADLTYDSFELSPTKPLRQQYQTLEKELNSGIPMQLAEPPIISKMVDRQLTLSWKPCATAGQRIPPTYIVEMAKMPEGDFGIVHHGVRGCSVEIKHLEPGCDYKFRLIAENKHGVSDPSPHVIAHRRELLPPPEDAHPTLPEGEQFRPGSSPLFPRGFDMEKYNSGRPHPPTAEAPQPVTGTSKDEDDGAWRYDRYDPETSRAKPASQRSVPPFPESYHPPAGTPERPGEPRPPAARLRPLSDDVDGYVPAAGGRHRRQPHGEEWEQRRGSNIIERLMVRKQMEEAAKSFTRSAGLESRGMARFMKPRGERPGDRMATIERRLAKVDDDDVDVPTMRPTPTPVRTVRPALSDDEDDDIASPSLYSPSRYIRPPSEPRQSAHARSILDEDDDDDDLTSYRRPAYHTRTASLIAAANNNDDVNDDDDYDITPYVRRPPRLLGSRDWAAKPARQARPAVSSMDRDFQERRERHAELINSRNQIQSTPPPAPATTTDWQSEFDRYMKGLGTSSGTKAATVTPVSAKAPAKKPAKDMTSARDWESRFRAHV